MGLIRLFLAFAVFMEHFSQQVLHNRDLPEFDVSLIANINGARAVFLFYVISGFLISYTLNRKYPATWQGTLAFYKSRFLRIYPLWWAVFAITCFLGGLTFWKYAQAFTLIGLDWVIALWAYPDRYWAMVPPTTAIVWTLSAELTFYAFAPWLLRRPRAAAVALAASFLIRCIIHVYWKNGDPGYGSLTFFFFPATAMFFLIGHFSAVLSRSVPLGLRGSLGLLLLSALLFWKVYPRISIDGPAEYIAVACFALSLPGIFACTKDSARFNYLGDLTYPLYISHSLTIGIMFWPFPLANGLGEKFIDHLLLPNASKMMAAIILSILTIVGAMLVSMLVHALVEEPLKRLFMHTIFPRLSRSLPVSGDIEVTSCSGDAVVPVVLAARADPTN